MIKFFAEIYNQNNWIVPDVEILDNPAPVKADIILYLKELKKIIEKKI